MTEPGKYHDTGRYIPVGGGSQSRLLPIDPERGYTYPGFYEDTTIRNHITTLTGHHDRVPRVMGLFDHIGG